jgi:hypothetical protein
MHLVLGSKGYWCVSGWMMALADPPSIGAVYQCEMRLSVLACRPAVSWLGKLEAGILRTRASMALGVAIVAM